MIPAACFGVGGQVVPFAVYLPCQLQVGSQRIGVVVGVDEVIAGVVGVLGRRVNSTEGSTGGLTIEVLFHMDRLEDSWHYRIREELHQVLEEEGFDWL